MNNKMDLRCFDNNKLIIILLIVIFTCVKFVSGVAGKARVPGGVFADLRANGVLTEDPLRRYNDVAYRWVSEDDWTYSVTFNGD